MPTNGTVDPPGIAAELRRLADAAATASAPLSGTEPASLQERVTKSIAEVALSWSGSWLGYHSRTYLRDFVAATGNDFFDAEWGGGGMAATVSAMRGNWKVYTYNEVRGEIMRRAAPCEYEPLVIMASVCLEATEDARDTATALLSALLAVAPDAIVDKARVEIESMPLVTRANEALGVQMPKSYMSRDYKAIAEGFKPPPHLNFGAMVSEVFSVSRQALALSRKLSTVALYIETKSRLVATAKDGHPNRSLLGHGRSNIWKDLARFLAERLGVPVDEFNREPIAGLTTTERLGTMLENCSMAFLLMTGEDVQVDGSLHARENVIHEIGLCQGHFGPRRAIVLLEEGCNEFSNIAGLGQIRFPAGDIGARFEQIRMVLEREGFIAPPTTRIPS